MKGAVSTIALFIIAVVVVAIGYNLYTQPAQTPTVRTASTTLTERECQSKLLTYCIQWSSNDYGRDSVVIGNRSGPWDAFAQGCNRLGVAPTTDVCDRVLKASATTGRATEVGRLGFLEQCNPRIDDCDTGLICKLGRDNTYRCLRQ